MLILTKIMYNSHHLPLIAPILYHLSQKYSHFISSTWSVKHIKKTLQYNVMQTTPSVNFSIFSPSSTLKLDAALKTQLIHAGLHYLLML